MATDRYSTPARAKRVRGEMGKGKRANKRSRTIQVSEGSTSSEEEDARTPTHLHKLLRYKRRGNVALTTVQRRVVDYIERNFVVPVDFERSHRYGPLSGMSFEERLIAAYHSEQLALRDKTKSYGMLKICGCCGECGHMQDDCPEKF